MEKATQNEMINSQNAFSEWIEKQMKDDNLSRDQVRYILTDKLFDMSRVDLYWDVKSDESDEAVNVVK